MKDDCIFCMIASGKIPSATIYEDSHFRVFLDINPVTKGHCLIVPKEHFENIYELDAETAAKVFSLATMLSRTLKKALKCDGMNIVQNNGTVAGQTVFHFHMHLIPRYDNDGVTILEEQAPGNMEEIEELRKLIKAEL